LAARAPTRRESYCHEPTHYQPTPTIYHLSMPSFDIVSEIDLQEVRNAVDQANREASTRFDFKNTNATIEMKEKELTLSASTEDRLRALYQLLEEKLVKRSVSLKSLDPSKIEEASQGAARQKVSLKAGISQDIGKQINKMVKEMGVKNLSSSIQGDQVRVTGKQRDDLQQAIAHFKEADLSVPRGDLRSPRSRSRGRSG
jgi:uncharacterized protein YajQ (UPF0234 family)